MDRFVPRPNCINGHWGILDTKRNVFAPFPYQHQHQCQKKCNKYNANPHYFESSRLVLLPADEFSVAPDGEYGVGTIYEHRTVLHVSCGCIFVHQGPDAGIHAGVATPRRVKLLCAALGLSPVEAGVGANVC